MQSVKNFKKLWKITDYFLLRPGKFKIFNYIFE